MTKTKSPYATTYHRDHTVTVWDVYRQSWLRTARPRDEVLASLGSDELEKVKRHCGIDD